MRTTAGSEFQILGAATETARLTVDVLVLGIKRAEVRRREQKNNELFVQRFSTVNLL